MDQNQKRLEWKIPHWFKNNLLPSIRRFLERTKLGVDTFEEKNDNPTIVFFFNLHDELKNDNKYFS
jgi:hypothetical protein